MMSAIIETAHHGRYAVRALTPMIERRTTRWTRQKANDHSPNFTKGFHEKKVRVPEMSALAVDPRSRRSRRNGITEHATR
jgi:hypothetical protein